MTNLELGKLFSTYGTVAFLSYIFGGVLADKYSPKKLLSFSLIFTSLGGFYMMSYPPYSSLQLLYAYWGFTTVFLFWAPMIKATSILGGLKKQGKTFSFLDAGRGIVASSIGLIGVLIFSFVVIGDISESTFDEKQDELAFASRHEYQNALFSAGYGEITSEILPAPEFYYAEEYHQQYLAKNPSGYCGLGGTGVEYPQLVLP